MKLLKQDSEWRQVSQEAGLTVAMRLTWKALQREGICPDGRTAAWYLRGALVSRAVLVKDGGKWDGQA